MKRWTVCICAQVKKLIEDILGKMQGKRLHLVSEMFEIFEVRSYQVMTRSQAALSNRNRCEPHMQFLIF